LLTINNGKHNVVTTPAFVDTPPTGLPPTTIANEPRFYAFQVTAPLTVLQYSRGPSNAVATPVTSLHSTAAAIPVLSTNSINVLDFTGLSEAIADVYVYDAAFTAIPKYVNVYWNGTTFNIQGGATGQIQVLSTGNVLQIKNNTNPPGATLNIFWSLKLIRVQVP